MNRPKPLKWRGSQLAMEEHQRACESLPPPRRKKRKGKRGKQQQPIDRATLFQRRGKEPGRRYTYAEYLLTGWWKQRRKTAIKRGGRKCAKCASTDSLQVHHLSYANLWDEKDADLQVLCKECHRREHASWIAANEHMDRIAKQI